MGAGASLDASSVLTKEEAKAIAGDQWDEAKWEASEKDEAGKVKAELLLAHSAPAEKEWQEEGDTAAGIEICPAAGTDEATVSYSTAIW